MAEKYTKGKIYLIWDKSYTKCYIGSTIESLSTRLAHHRYKYNRFKNGLYHYVSIYDLFDEFGIDNCLIELLENYSCNSKDELRSREGYHIRQNECINKRIENRSLKEWREERREELLEKKKQYREQNKELIREKARTYYNDNKEKLLEKINCDCGCIVSRTQLTQHLRTTKQETKLESKTEL